MRKLGFLIIVFVFLSSSLLLQKAVKAEEVSKTFLVHLKTSLDRDDAQICVAYNVIWAALREGYEVKVLVDADAVNTFKIGWRGKDDIEGYKLPQNLRKELSSQFGVSLESVPKTYGEYLQMLKEKGAQFYVNRGMLIVAKLGTPEDLLKKISAKFFKPVTIKEMIQMISQADAYAVY